MKSLIYGVAIAVCMLMPQNSAWAEDFPQLTITEPGSGAWNFMGASAPLPLAIVPGELLDFSWIGDASSYGGTIQDYRYGWDIVDPGDDGQWDQPWCSTCLSAPTRSFSSGTHVLMVEVRDDLGSITRATIVMSASTVKADEAAWSMVKRLYRD